MVDDFFKNADVARSLRGILRQRGVEERDIEDCVQDVYEAVLVWSRKVGLETVEEMGKAAGVIAKRIATKYWRTVATRGRHNVGLTGDADERVGLENPTAIELVDVQKVIDEINRMLAEGKLSEKGAAVIRALAMGDTLADHAEQTGQSPEAVRKTAQRSKEAVVERLHDRKLDDVGLRSLLSARALAVAVAVAIVLMALYSGVLRGFGHEPIAHHDRDPQVVPDAAAPPLVPEMPKQVLTVTQESRDKAAAVLHEAELAYKRHEWRRCIGLAEEVQQLDPTETSAAQLVNDCAYAEMREGNSKGSPPKR